MSAIANRSVEQSWSLWQEAQTLIGAGTGTLSKRATLEGDEPAYIVRGKGCRIWDLDGNEYIDYRNSLGPITLGYCYPAVDDAIRAQLEQGIIFGHPHPLEVELARELVEVLPCAEKVRFLKTGGEAMAACIRLARAFTRRPRIVTCGYHGWLSRAGTIEHGLPEAIGALQTGLSYGDLEAFSQYLGAHASETAAVCVAAAYDQIGPDDDFLPKLRALTREHNVLLVYDEIVTGFRVRTGGMQEYTGAVPDLATFAKGLANGMPLSCYCGRADIMDVCAQAGISSTYSGDTLSLAASLATVREYRTKDVIGHLWARGREFTDGMNELFAKHGLDCRAAGCPACPSIGIHAADPLLRRVTQDDLWRAFYRNGVSLYNVSYVNFSHSAADIAETLERMDRAMAEVAGA
ncbi:MAG: aspartate aminotransferase family protein [Armatimonadetes bacterium CG_4_9_14_3_um_filter_66_14]|nr:MAG: aspartate aminotransferase family protein [Armatimonadetes bacterium CG_4_9_14_3_um_filter_66_14]